MRQSVVFSSEVRLAPTRPVSPCGWLAARSSSAGACRDVKRIGLSPSPRSASGRRVPVHCTRCVRLSSGASSTTTMWAALGDRLPHARRQAQRLGPTHSRRARSQAGGSASPPAMDSSAALEGCLSHQRALQMDTTWAEDRATLRSDPSAVPRAKTEGRAVHGDVYCPPPVSGLAPKRQTVAAGCRVADTPNKAKIRKGPRRGYWRVGAKRYDVLVWSVNRGEEISNSPAETPPEVRPYRGIQRCRDLRRRARRRAAPNPLRLPRRLPAR
jgi:hypothetical protein